MTPREVAAALAAPVEPAPISLTEALAVSFRDVVRLTNELAVERQAHAQAHRAGAEWMREQAARVADRNDLSAWGIAREIRSLPVSPPAPEEAK